MIAERLSVTVEAMKYRPDKEDEPDVHDRYDYPANLPDSTGPRPGPRPGPNINPVVPNPFIRPIVTPPLPSGPGGTGGDLGSIPKGCVYSSSEDTTLMISHASRCNSESMKDVCLQKNVNEEKSEYSCVCE